MNNFNLFLAFVYKGHFIFKLSNRVLKGGKTIH